MKPWSVALIVIPLLGACVAPMEDPMPTSPYQWERRQTRIEREHAARQAQCEAARTDEARARWCGQGEPSR